MAKKIIRVGDTANDKKGDSLRSAFIKVNENFTELYTALGIAADTTLNLGAFTFTGSTMSTDDSTNIVIDKPITVNGEITVDGDIVPKTNLGASLGTPTKQFKSLYVSTNTVFLGGVPLSLEAGTNELTINNVPISQTINYTDIPNAPKDLSDLTDNNGSLGGGGGGSTLVNGASTVSLGSDGSVVFPTLTVPRGDRSGTLTGQTLLFGDSTQGVIISTPNGTVDNNSSQRLVINPGEGATGTSGEGGDIYLYAGRGGDAGGSGGDIKIRGGLGISTGAGGYIDIESGESSTYGNGGDITITARDGGRIVLRTYNSEGTSRDLVLDNAGRLTFPSGMTMGDLDGVEGIRGSVNTTVGILSLGTGGTSVLQWVDDPEDATAVAAVVVNSLFAANTGTVQIITGDVGPVPEYSWTFGPDGDLTLPDGGPIWFGGNNCRIQAGQGFLISSDGGILVEVADKQWVFGPDGSIAFPDGTEQTTAAAPAFSFSVAADDSTQRVISNNELIKFIGAGGITTSSDAEGYITITGSAGSVSSLVNGAYTLSLGNTGALTLPAGGVISEGGGLTGAIKLTPAGGANANQALLIYPTAGGDGDHIHLTAGGGTTELYLGNDSRYVKLVNNGDIAVLANNGAANRVFNWVGQGGWNQASYTAVATTGGTGTGLTVNVAAGGAGYININLITINNPGTGYTVGDVITINNENNLPGSFQIGVAANNWTFGTDGSLASNEFKIKTLDGVPTSITGTSQDTQLWDYNYGTGLATTGGSGTGLTVNVSDGGSGYASIEIQTAGTGYTPNDIITVTNGPFNGAGAGSSVTFTIGISGTRNWLFDRYGALTLPSGTSNIQSVQSGNTQSFVTLNPFRVCSQVRTSQTQTYSMAGEDFTTATSNGAGAITFQSPGESILDFFTDIFDYGAAFNRTVRINGAGPEYEYSSFANVNNQLNLATAAPEGAVTEIRFSYNRISKIDIDPDAGVFRIESEPGLDMNIQAGDQLSVSANTSADIIAGTGMSLRSGSSSVQISTNYGVPGATTRTWTFGTGGELNLPNGAVLRNTLGNAIAFGQGAGLNSQGNEAVAIGINAGYDFQGANAVAIGVFAGETSQGTNAIAIGNRAGFFNQAANSIIINATGATLDQTTANTFTVAPIRNISATSGVLQYNASTKEVSYSNSVTAETFNTDQITVVGNRITTTVTNANLELECNGTGGVVVNSGKLILNPGGTNIIESSENSLGIYSNNPTRTNGLEIFTNSETNLFNQSKVRIISNVGTVNRVWEFGTNGNLTFPDATVQSTAFTTSPTLNILKIDDGVHEKFQTKADATGTVTHDCASGHIFYHTSPDANWTANFTNLNLASGYATTVSLIIVQGGTGYYPNAVQIGGSAQTILWQGNTTPTVSTNRTDVASFSIINNSGTYVVLGQITGF